MSYYIRITRAADIVETETRTREALAAEGFGVVMEMDVRQTLIDKTGSDIGPYKILGACNPGFAKKAIAAEPQIGTLLPCNILLRDLGDGTTEIAAVDPVASMQAVENPALAEMAGEVRQRLERVVTDLD